MVNQHVAHIIDLAACPRLYSEVCWSAPTSFLCLIASVLVIVLHEIGRSAHVKWYEKEPETFYVGKSEAKENREDKNVSGKNFKC